MKDKISPLIDLKDLRTQFGATEFQFKLLIREGFFKPTLLRKRARKTWGPAPVMEFLECYQKKSTDVTEAGTDWESLHDAAVSRRIPVSTLIGWIKQAELSPEKRKGLSGYAALCVRTDQVNAKLSSLGGKST